MRSIFLVLLLLVTVGCDQITKHIARVQLTGSNIVSLPGHFGEFRLAQNPGSFLSLGASFTQTLRLTLFTIVVGLGLIALFLYLLNHGHLDRLTFFALALSLSGGLSNLIDRFTFHGTVTDFITLRLGPLHTGVFNLADIFILAGLGLLLASNFRKESPSAASITRP
jgi:signal peptidase II